MNDTETLYFEAFSHQIVSSLGRLCVGYAVYGPGLARSRGHMCHGMPTPGPLGELAARELWKASSRNLKGNISTVLKRWEKHVKTMKVADMV